MGTEIILSFSISVPSLLTLFSWSCISKALYIEDRVFAGPMKLVDFVAVFRNRTQAWVLSYMVGGRSVSVWWWEGKLTEIPSAITTFGCGPQSEHCMSLFISWRRAKANQAYSNISSSQNWAGDSL